MRAALLVPVEEYLSTVYRPDCEYVDGVVVERKLGGRDHSTVQMVLGAFLYNRREEFGIHVFPEQRVQVKADRFRVPDLCVVAGEKPQEQIFRTPPFLGIEILSRDDRMDDVLERVQDYLEFGVPYVWILSPRHRTAHVYTADGIHAENGILRTQNPEIVVPLREIFASF